MRFFVLGGLAASGLLVMFGLSLGSTRSLLQALDHAEAIRLVGEAERALGLPVPEAPGMFERPGTSTDSGTSTTPGMRPTMGSPSGPQMPSGPRWPPGPRRPTGPGGLVSARSPGFEAVLPARVPATAPDSPDRPDSEDADVASPPREMHIGDDASRFTPRCATDPCEVLDPGYLETRDLVAVVERLSPEGLRYLGLFSGETLLAESGKPAIDVPVREALEQPVRRGERVRAVMPARLPPPPSDWSDHDLAARGPPMFAIEFEPQLSAVLERDMAATTLAVAGAFLAVILSTMGLVRLVRERTRLQDKLARDAALSALGRMSAVLSHEIRNPLASLKGNAQLMLEVCTTEGQTRKAQRVVDEAQRLERMVEGVLAFVRSGRVEPVQTSPEEVVRSAVDATHIGVDIEAKSAPARWKLDPIRMRQVLVNLLENARDAGAQSISLTMERAGNALVIRLLDDGCGVPDETDIFEPFVTGKTRGTGLGLAVARKIVEAHGGEIFGRRRREGGSEFVMMIPEDARPATSGSGDLD